MDKLGLSGLYNIKRTITSGEHIEVLVSQGFTFPFEEDQEPLALLSNSGCRVLLAPLMTRGETGRFLGLDRGCEKSIIHAPERLSWTNLYGTF